MWQPPDARGCSVLERAISIKDVLKFADLTTTATQKVAYPSNNIFTLIAC